MQVIYESFTGGESFLLKKRVKTYSHENHNPIPAVQFNKYIEIMKLLANYTLTIFHTLPSIQGSLMPQAFDRIFLMIFGR